MGNALRPLFEHNLWANLRLLHACRALSDEQLALTIGGVYGTPTATLVHYIGGEHSYVYRLTGERAPTPFRGDSAWPGIGALIEQARWSGERLLELAGSMSLETVVLERFEGREDDLAAGVVFVQAINHSTEHRAHVVTTLSAHGITMPAIDGWAWGDESGGVKLRGT